MTESGLELLAGEKVDLAATSQLEKSPIDPEKRYVEGEVRIVTDQARYPLSAVPTLLASGDYKLNPDFQRRHRWDSAAKSKLIESFIMNVPIPPIFLYEDEFGHYEVMDGLQRLTAISEFYGDVFALIGLSEWEQLNGFRYSTLPEKIRKGIDRRYLSSIILLQETAKTPELAQELKQLVFERINSGGVRLTPQESRNALRDGPMNRRCRILAREGALCRLWGIPEPSDTELATGEPAPSDSVWTNEDYRSMADAELVLRFFAYRQLLDLQKNLALRDYLDSYLDAANKFSPDLLDALTELFKKTINFAEDLLGQEAFYLWRERKNGTWNWNRRSTLAAYDPWMIVLSQLLPRAPELLAQAEDIRVGLKSYYEHNLGEWGGRTADAADITRRISSLTTFLHSYLSPAE
ncbi:DUF262 domain-containing protein [Cryobacterium sp. TMT2-10]|uniref:DUF262 domain-containing protein n=1 Tax=Cryobacterium sp. TMT2-10 TaxID=1259244 RepID=UPI00106C10BC|nr:DUF262 domain-containing protein [Cryobacterium sp. TMT2-10]TFD38908.1 DUF262 domain-containing protein [Cryobacterium sp. TMT2-10]